MAEQIVATLVGSQGLGEITSLTETAQVIVGDNNTFLTAKPGVIAARFNLRNAANAALAALLGEGTFFHMGGLLYKVQSGGTACNDLGVSGIAPGGIVTAEHWGATEYGSSVDARSAINSAMQYCATNGVMGRSMASKYDVRGTIAPGGQLFWDFGVTEFSWQNVDFFTEDLTATATWTEAQENPNGTSAQQGSGKYVLFDTKGMTRSHLAGHLRIRQGSPGSMTLAARATIKDNIIALTNSDGVSSEMNWDSIEFIGCGECLWHGDQRGTGSQILPYTGWKVGRFTAQFCLRCVFGGQSGNTFDDAHFGIVRWKRNAEFGVLRTEFCCDTLFMNAFQEVNGDAEPETVTFPRATSSDNTFTISDTIDGLAEGDVVYAYGANLGPDGSTAIPFVSQITSASGTLTTESVPDQAVTDAVLHINPTKPLRLVNAMLKADYIFFEEAADGFIECDQESTVEGTIKVSDGRIGCRYNTPIYGVARNGFSVQGHIHQRSENTVKVKGLVGVPVMYDTLNDTWSSANVQLTSSQPTSLWTNGVPVASIELEADHLPDNSATDNTYVFENRNADLHDGSYNAACTFSDGRVQYFVSGVKQEAYKTGPNGGFEVGPNLRSNEDMAGVTVTGADTSLAAGQVTKVAGAAGTAYEAVTVATGDRLRVVVAVSALTAGQILIRAYDSGGVNITGKTIRVRITGTYLTAYLDAPAGMARIGLELPDASAGVIDALRVQKVISA